MRRTARILPAALTLTAALLLTMLTAPAAATVACARVDWGSTHEQVTTMSSSPVVAARAGRHTCFDRVVLQVAGSTGTGYTVAYVPAVTQDGSGFPLDVPGGARLSAVVHHPVTDEVGRLLFDRPIGAVVNVAGFPTLRSVVYGGSFEGRTLFGVGTRARLPFRVFTLAGPGGDSRIVLDIAHTWN